MKTYFIEAKTELGKVSFDTKELPKKVGLVTTIQFLTEMKKVSEFLKTKGIESALAGQVLGCDATVTDKLNDKVDAFLYIGTGEFHPLAVALRTVKPVFTMNPYDMKVKKISQSAVDKIKAKKMGMLNKFYNSKNIGVIITTKDGQSRVQGGIKTAEDIQKKFKDKKFYYFLCDTLDFTQLDNFPFIDCWVNTMCPRIMEDIKILNIQDIQEL